MMTSIDDVQRHREAGSWRRLVAVAHAIVSEVERDVGLPMAAVLGGGTRLMLALNHRISHDIDLFITDVQFIGHLSPRLNDRVAERTTDYDEDHASLKLRFEDGEIDFIAAAPLLKHPVEFVTDIDFGLDSVAEVLAKKLYYRGWALTPRDLFDWWSIGQQQPQTLEDAALRTLLGGKHAVLAESLSAFAHNAGFIRHWDAILAPQRPALDGVIAWAKRQLADLRPLDDALPTPP